MHDHRTLPTPLPTRLLSLLAALALALAGALATGSAARADAPAEDQRTARYEVDFMTGMIDHHTMAIMMSEMCLEKAVHPELKGMCEEIIAAQEAEIEQMQTWLEDWYGVTYEPQMNMNRMQRFERLEGADFEIAFMESMQRHHFRAVGEAEKCLERAEHDELLAMCDDIIEVQLAEIAQLQTWLCEWYDRCGGRPVETA